MFEWEIVRKAFGSTTTVDTWTTKYVNDSELKETCNSYTHNGAIVELYVSFPGYEHELYMVVGKYPTLAAHGHPGPGMRQF